MKHVNLKQENGYHKAKGAPFAIIKENFNAETVAAMNEYCAIKKHPEKYKRYSTFEEAMKDVLEDA